MAELDNALQRARAGGYRRFELPLTLGKHLRRIADAAAKQGPAVPVNMGTLLASLKMDKSGLGPRLAAAIGLDDKASVSADLLNAVAAWIHGAYVPRAKPGMAGSDRREPLAAGDRKVPAKQAFMVDGPVTVPLTREPARPQ